MLQAGQEEREPLLDAEHQWDKCEETISHQSALTYLDVESASSNLNLAAAMDSASAWS